MHSGMVSENLYQKSLKIYKTRYDYDEEQAD